MKLGVRAYYLRASLACLHDIAMAAAAFALAISLRLGENPLIVMQQRERWLSLLIFTGVCACVFVATNLYRGVWRYASLNDMLNIVRAATISVLVFLPATFLATRLEDVPRSSLIIVWLLLIALLAGPRLIYRLFKDGSLAHAFERNAHLKVPVVMIGAGDRAEQFISAMLRERHANYEILAVLDEKGRRVGRRIHNVPVIGDLQDLDGTFERIALRSGRQPQRIVLSKHLPADLVNRLLEFAETKGLSLDRLPSMTDLSAADALGAAETQPIRIEDLLRRPQTVLDPQPVHSLVSGRSILVTGAGGSIGSELVRQLARLGPRELVLLESSEFNLYRIEREVAETCPDLPRVARLADVRDATAVERAFERYRPEIVFHAAALKHVPIVELQPAEGVRTNVVGTRIVAEACRRFDTQVMVLISTDKAVNPTNVMGACKRLAESYCQALDLQVRRSGKGPRYVTVRFGNVLGSSGSVVPLFQHQLAHGGPLTVTHPDMTRYFMTISEAVRLVLQSAAHGVGRQEAEAGKIYVLDMGEPVKILELAEQIVRLGGKRPYKDVEIVFTGLRPGEKLHEELFHEQEQLVDTERSGLRLAAPRTPELDLLRRGLDELAAAAEELDEGRVREILGVLVPEWRTGAEVISLNPKTRRKS